MTLRRRTLKRDKFVRLAVYQPDIAQNLGAMIRLCACFGVPIDVIEPCGFPFSVKALRRSAMDYADIADITRHNDWEAFLKCHDASRIVLLTTKAPKSLWNFNFESDDILLVGRESAGVPTKVANNSDEMLLLPMPGGGRSMNVAMSAGIALGEAMRQVGFWNET